MISLFKHLLPRALAWSITKVTKPLRLLFDGLVAGLLEPAKLFMDLLWFDIFPQYTRKLADWEWQFGLQKAQLAEQERRDRLDARWASLVGGQSPKYIQDVLQAHGFDVYIHEWWVPASDPAVARDPTSIGGSAYVLPNRLFEVEQVFTALCGEVLMECGEALAECGQYSGYVVNQIVTPVPVSSGQWPYVFYIGGATWPNAANVDATRQAEFEDLVLKLKPAQQWPMFIITYV